MTQCSSPTLTSDSSSQSDWIENARFDAAHTDDPTVIVDLSAVEQIDTRQLGDLIRLHLDIKRDERQLVLENVRECVLQVMQLTRLDRLIRIDQSQSV